jgi:sugar phosphate isomerase/epimerase
MKEPITRRQFIEGTGRIAAGAASLALFAGARGAAGDEKPALAVAIRDTHLRETGEKDCWSAMKSIGAEGVEADVGEDYSFAALYGPAKYSIADEASTSKLAADLKAAGLRITALCLHNRFDERPEKEFEWCVRAARAAKALGAKAVRIDVWPRKLKVEEFRKFAVDLLKKILAETEDTAIPFGIENHGGTTNDPEFLKALFEGVGSKRLGLTLDTGNFYWFGHPLAKLYELYEALAPRVVHTHCKSIKYPETEREKRRAMGWEYEKYNCPIDEGDIDFRRVVKILRAAGYSNDLCIEDESLGKLPKEQRGKSLARQIAFLKGLR